jgi:glycosyltransferase involved in cell wall biosynthesis
LTESFACGVPAIANDRGSVPEIAGEAALLVDPARPDLLAQSLQELCASSERREELRRRGVERVRFFDWNRTAQETYAVYCRAAQSRGRL